MLRAAAWFVSLSGALALGAGCELVAPTDEELSGGGGKRSDGGVAAPGPDSSAAGGVRPIQQVTALGAAARAVVVKLPSAPASRNALVLVAASSDTTPSSVSGAGVQWVQQSRSAVHMALAIWVAFAPSGSAPAEVTVTWPAAPEPAQTTTAVHLSEWSAIAAIGPDVLANGGSATIATAPLVVSDRTALVLGAAAAHRETLGAPTNGFIALEGISTGDLELAVAYLPAPPAGTYSTSWAYPSAQGWDAHLASFTR